MLVRATQTGIVKLIVAIIPLGIAMAMPILQEDKDQWSRYAMTNAEVESPIFVVSEELDLDTYLEETSDLFPQLDKEVVAIAKKLDESTRSGKKISLAESQ